MSRSSRPGTVISRRWTSSSSRVGVSKASAFRASSHELSVPRTRLSTYGDRAFPVATVRIWNSLPQHVISAQSLPVFCMHSLEDILLRTVLFMKLLLCQVRSDVVILDTLIVLLTYLKVDRPGVERATCWSQMQVVNHARRNWAIGSSINSRVYSETKKKGQTGDDEE